MKKRRVRTFGLSRLAFGIPLLCALGLAAQDNSTYIQRAVRFAVSPPVRELAKLPQPPGYGFHEANPARPIPKSFVGPVTDTVEQSGVPSAPDYGVVADFLGIGNGFPNYTVGGVPPDANLAVGDTQIVQWVNVSYTVCNKTTLACGPAIAGNTLWTNLGGICAANNDGDIIVQWDVAAHRWLLSQPVFIGNYGVCVAVSTTTDANGSYYLYEFPVVNNGFPDYQKWGIWPGNYGQTWNNFGPGGSGFQGAVFCAYNSAKLLVGDGTAEQICHQYTTNDDSLLPGDRDSPTAPPGGQDQFAIGSLASAQVSLYSLHINNPSNWSQGATFTGDNNSQPLSIAAFTPSCGINFSPCVPQKGVPDLLESLGDRLMYRFAYWEDQPIENVKATPPKPTPSQHWLVNFDVTASGGNLGPRWMEFTAPIRKLTLPQDLSKFTLFQQGTYNPDGNWRWMGSVARDKLGDILIGYSESCGNTCPGGTPTYPSIYVSGRPVNFTLGRLEDEVPVVVGTGSQTDSNGRWGDYSSMRIDTNDGMGGCTFWYTTEYYMVTASRDWSTQIASIKFSNCK